MPVNVTVYPDLASAAQFLRSLALLKTSWTFDIETYDAAAFPSRKVVAVDPHHPDFRVRGCAVAWSPTDGAWLEFPRIILTDAEVAGREDLRAAFASDAEKGAFNGGFDECGLVYTGWVPRVRNRTRDGMLSMVALGDGTHARLTLAHAVETLLRREAYWGEDKAQMRDLPLRAVADGSVRDACYTHELCDMLDAWAEEGRHIEWSRLERAASGAAPQAPQEEVVDEYV